MSASLVNDELEAAQNPFALFVQWLEAARKSEINDPEAMALATVDAAGLPDVRMVLCKEVEAAALVFYTNVESAKGRQIEATHGAAALFHWKFLRRQVRFRGVVAEIGAERADAYFRSRPRISQLGAWASRQSSALDSRAALEERLGAFTARFGEGEIPRPPYWRGFKLDVTEVELWADGAHRLHDRIRFVRSGEGWSRQRLYP